MEKQHGQYFYGSVLKAEFVGTCLLMLACNMIEDAEENTLMPLAYFSLVMCFYDISGGHLNPAISIGVWLSEKRYVQNLMFMILIHVAQCLGAIVALSLGFMLRVSVTEPNTGEKYLLPDAYASTPPLLVSADGIPSYGQIMLSETIGTFIFVLVAVKAREHMK